MGDGVGGNFLSRVFGNRQGYLCIVTIRNGARSSRFFNYPDDLDSALERIDEWRSQKGTNVYFLPALLEDPDLDSEVVSCPMLSADLDIVDPVLLLPRPDIIIESSPGRFQALWSAADQGEEFTPQSVNGPVACDLGLRRIPGTHNWKYSGSDPWLVREINPTSLKTFEAVAQKRKLTGASFNHLFASGDRWALSRLCARLGCNATETYLVLLAAQGNTDTNISDLYREAIEAVKASGVPTLLTDDEACGGEHCAGSFVDKYLEWATRCTDSPKQYHVAGALMVLSAALCPYIRLPTAFGEFKPNLWFMILGETTLTRKTTATRMALNLARCIDPDVVLSTNGSVEGITEALAARDGQTSLFYAGEVVGFLRECSRKQYLSGLLQTLTGLYDGDSLRRTLRSRVTEVTDPNFLIFCEGIKSDAIAELDVEHIASGFLPRFLPVFGHSRVEDLKPIGPPGEDTSHLRDKLILYLEGLAERYADKPKLLGGKSKPVRLNVTNLAWDRLRQLEADARRFGQSSDNPKLFGPLYERLMNSIIKVAMLLAADRAYRENTSPVLDLQDVVAAIGYSPVWVESMVEMVKGIEDKPTREEIQILKVANAIRASEDGMTHSEVMRKFSLTSKGIETIVATLEGRGLIVKSRVSRATVYQAASREF